MKILFTVGLALLLCSCRAAEPPLVDTVPLAEALRFLGGAIVLSTIIAVFGRLVLRAHRDHNKEE
jgi:hypothetical protein